jgi:hypothetical protein
VAIAFPGRWSPDKSADFFHFKVTKMFTQTKPSRVPVMERLIVIVLPSKPGRFSARLESTCEVIVTNSKQPLLDGARELLAAGFNLRTPLTMRHDGSSHDSFEPLPIVGWADLHRGQTTSLRCARWMPVPLLGRGKSRVPSCRVYPTYPGAKTSVRSDLPGSGLTPAAGLAVAGRLMSRPLLQSLHLLRLVRRARQPG